MHLGARSGLAASPLVSGLLGAAGCAQSRGVGRRGQLSAQLLHPQHWGHSRLLCAFGFALAGCTVTQGQADYMGELWATERGHGRQ